MGGGVRSKVNPAWGVRSRSNLAGGSGQRSIQWGGVRSSWQGVRVKGQSSWGKGGSGSKVNPARGVSQVKGQSSQGGGVRSKVNPVGGGSGPASWGGQHLAPSCGQYASCVHAGGLSCTEMIFQAFHFLTVQD